MSSSCMPPRRVKRKAPPALADDLTTANAILAVADVAHDPVTIVSANDSVLSLTTPHQFILTPDANSPIEAAYRALTSNEGKSKAEPTVAKKKKKYRSPVPDDEPHYRRASQTLQRHETQPSSSGDGSSKGRHLPSRHHSNLSSYSITTDASTTPEKRKKAVRRRTLQTNLTMTGEELSRTQSIDSNASHSSKLGRFFRLNANGSRSSLLSKRKFSKSLSTTSLGSRSMTSMPILSHSKSRSVGFMQTLRGVSSEMVRGNEGPPHVDLEEIGLRSVSSDLPRTRLWGGRGRRTPSSSPLKQEAGGIGEQLGEKVLVPEHALPAHDVLVRASELTLVAEDGLRVRFGDVFMKEKTIVYFIQHLCASSCLDYLKSIGDAVDPALLKSLGINLVIVGNGAPGMIKSYRQIFSAPHAIYIDPSLELYRTLGMIRLGETGSAQGGERWESVKQSVFSGLANVVKRALKVRMSVGEKGGDPEQLGGEFVLGPGLTCTFAHRMQTKQSHTPIFSLLDAAGMNREAVSVSVQSSQTDVEDEDAWMAKRRQSYLRLREKRRNRRRDVHPVDDFTETIDTSFFDPSPLLIPLPASPPAHPHARAETETNSAARLSSGDESSSCVGSSTPSTPDLERRGTGNTSGSSSDEDERAAVDAGEAATKIILSNSNNSEEEVSSPAISDVEWMDALE